MLTIVCIGESTGGFGATLDEIREIWAPLSN